MKQVLFGFSTGAPSGTEYSSIMGHPGSLGHGSGLAGRRGPRRACCAIWSSNSSTAPGGGHEPHVHAAQERRGHRADRDDQRHGDHRAAHRRRCHGRGGRSASRCRATRHGRPGERERSRWSLEFEGTTAKESGYSQAVGADQQRPGRAIDGRVRLVRAPSSTTARRMRATWSRRPGRSPAHGRRRRARAPGGGTASRSTSTRTACGRMASGGTVNTACALARRRSRRPVRPTACRSRAGDLRLHRSDRLGHLHERQWSLGHVVCGDDRWRVAALRARPMHAIEHERHAIRSGPERERRRSRPKPTFASARDRRGDVRRPLRLQVLLIRRPGGRRVARIDLRVNAASAGPTVTISDAATTGSDLVNTATSRMAISGTCGSCRPARPRRPSRTGASSSAPTTAVVARSTPFVGPLIVTG